ncbi:MAG: queuosine precursor transporter [Pseudomonadota bacterium]
MQHYELTAASDSELQERRERVYIVLAGFFLSAMTLLNVIGITRFVDLGPMTVAVGVLPYPLTFLCTDLISELYGRSRANFLVTVGLVLNLFILGVLTIANLLPAAPIVEQPPWQVLQIDGQLSLPNGDVLSGSVELFQILYACTAGAVAASMFAYIAAQYLDVRLFHFWKRVTKGKHLWLRNNFSTLISQAVDSIMVIGITFGAVFLAGEMALATILVLMASNYVFKMLVALIDTLPFYILTNKLRKYLAIDSQAGLHSSTGAL